MTGRTIKWAQAAWQWGLGLSLRAVVIVVLLGYCVQPSSFVEIPALDELSAKAASYLVEAPQTLRGVTVIEVPEPAMRLWTTDMHSAGTLSALLSNILHSQKSFVSVILPQPILIPSGPSEELVERVAAEDLTAQTLVDRKLYLIELLENDRVVLGVQTRLAGWNIAGAKPLGRVEPSNPNLPMPLTQWAWEPVPNAGEALRTRPRLDHYPVLTATSATLNLLYRQGGVEDVFPHFLLQHLRDEQRRVWTGSASFPFSWSESGQVRVGNSQINTSPSGEVIPLWGLTSRMTPYIERLSLEEGLARGAFPEHVYIVPKGSDAAIQTLLAASSFRQGDYLWQPAWVMPALKLTVLLFLVYLLWGVPRLQLKTGLWVTSAMLVCFVVAAIVAGATRHVWVPVGAPILLLLCGHVAMLVWAAKQKSLKSLSVKAENASVLLASIHLSNGSLDEAYEALKDCSASEEAFQYLYELSGLYASKRKYDRAIEALDTLIERSPDYKDAKQKRNAIESVYRSQQNTLEKTTLMIDATVAIDAQAVDRPVLGRYEIRRALGKGAMGQVYLGFDPRIARQVAIKTLSYSQFDPAQLPEIKQRFFREAEAAGRLNHPNIVSVYDLGEEPDLAFIAMDYVEGSSLSAFVNANHLLPAFEVYRIVHDVALALEYAHQNQIVHRDIKPGNIMYRPSPYHLKVADFGIARLTDNSQTTTGEILGSPLFMAPEQLKGKKVDYAADLFSLGVTFYQLLSGELPFKGDNLASLTYEIIHGKHKSVRQVRKDLPTSAARITNQALQKDASDRYASAADMATALNKAIKRDFSQEAKRAGFN